jgi:hypothetical protein
MQMSLMEHFADQSSQFGLSHCTCSLLTLSNMVQVLSYWAIAVPVVLWYSLATPGPLAGLVEFFQGPMHANTFRSFSPEDVEIGRQMGEGSFGIVHEGYIGKGEEWNERWYLDMQDDHTVHLSGPAYSPCIIHCRDYAFLLWN